MKLFNLLKGINTFNCNADLNLEVEKIASDHRNVSKNTVFVAIKGTKRDGNDYIKDAIKKGAVAIVTDDIKSAETNPSSIFVNDTREVLAKMWSNFYGNPSKGIKTVAITGTNGKTSSAFFLYNILASAGISCGLISTVGCFINGKQLNINGGGAVPDISSTMTTPDPEALYYLYNKMKENDVEIAVIEASSHALTQKRLCGIEVEIGAFTNLSREHLDYHGDIEEYFKAKEILFKMCKLGIVNIDDEYGLKLKELHPSTCTFSIKGNADFCAKNIFLSEKGCEYELEYKGEKIKIKASIIGEFTVYNTLLASCCALLLGVDKGAIAKGIFNTELIKGRVEKYRDKSIYIDYAHTPEAMKNVILTVKQIEQGKRLVVLFGCGGDRDKGKRAEMGKICTEFADYTVITSDNPRSEDPKRIIEDILSGIDKSKHFAVIENRRDAIKKIVQELTDNDALLLLGKGHEEYEITKEGKHFFSERKVLDEVFLV